MGSGPARGRNNPYGNSVIVNGEFLRKNKPLVDGS